MLPNGVRDIHDYFSKCFITQQKSINYSGDYFKYVGQYWQHREDPNFTVVVYERMKREPRKAIEMIAEFLGEKYVKRLSQVMTDSSDGNKVETLLDRIESMSSMSAMKGKYGSDIRLRKGIVGDWRSHLTKEESDLIDVKVREEWTGTGLDVLWEQDMKWID